MSLVISFGHSQPSPTLLSQGCMRLTCHLHLWQNNRGLLRATAITGGGKRTTNNRQHTKITLEKKFLPPLQPGSQPLDQESGTLANKLSWLVGKSSVVKW